MQFARVLKNDEALAETIAACLTQREQRPGQRLPTEREWAVELGLTRHQVRRGLERLVRTGRLVRRRSDGYYVATPTPYRRSRPATAVHTLGFLAAENYVQYNVMHPMRRLVDAARAASYEPLPLVFDPTQMNDLSALAHAVENRLFDAFFWMPMASPHVNEVVALLQKFRVPVVCLTEGLLSGPSAVMDDYRRVGSEAARMIASAGHRRVLAVTYDDPLLSRSTIGIGLRASLALEPRVQLEELFIRGWFYEEAHRDLAQRLGQAIEHFKPTAIFAGSRMLSELVLGVLAERGLRMPEDISFVGYAALGVGRLRGVDCTCLQSDEDLLVKIAMAELERLIQNPADETTRQLHLPPVIHLGSTLKPRTEGASDEVLALGSALARCGNRDSSDGHLRGTPGSRINSM